MRLMGSHGDGQSGHGKHHQKRSTAVAGCCTDPDHPHPSRPRHRMPDAQRVTRGRRRGSGADGEEQALGGIEGLFLAAQEASPSEWMSR
jgi:hypothetical protein